MIMLLYSFILRSKLVFSDSSWTRQPTERERTKKMFCTPLFLNLKRRFDPRYLGKHRLVFPLLLGIAQNPLHIGRRAERVYLVIRLADFLQVNDRRQFLAVLLPFFLAPDSDFAQNTAGLVCFAGKDDLVFRLCHLVFPFPAFWKLQRKMMGSVFVQDALCILALF